ncbi:MAG: InlB B-repeat-containing protein [Christensenellaceae bacterium]|jgi:hypothetical protein|nr:InlB B-repeat-containing protein [Christensenellaceae bacterium]
MPVALKKQFIVLVLFSAMLIFAIYATGCLYVENKTTIDNNQLNEDINNITIDIKPKEGESKVSYSSITDSLKNDEDHPTYILSYSMQGGNSKPNELVSTVQISPQATRVADGQFRYVLDGWYTDSGLNNRVTFPYTLIANTTFYAKWVFGIETIQELKNIDLRMNADYRLMNDLLLNNIEWIPLGLHLAPPDEKGRENTVVIPADGGLTTFTGTLNGAKRDANGNDSTNERYKLYNLSIMPIAEEQSYHYMPYGLFALIGKSADGSRRGTVSNLEIVSARIFLDGGFSRFFIGGITGKLVGGLIQNCQVNGIINNPELIYEGSMLDDFLGTTYGYASPTIHTFLGLITGGVSAGGEINNSFTSGVISSASVSEGVFVGGIAGFNWDGRIVNSYSSANVYGRYSGGLTGYNNSTIDNSYATGIITASMSYACLAGGVTAYNDISGVITKTYATGNVSARTAGGLVAVNIFNYSSVSPPNIAGDIIFEALKDSPGVDSTQVDAELAAQEKAVAIGVGTGGIIKNCFASGKVTGNEYAGGLIARAESIIPITGVSGIKAKPLSANSFFIANNFAYGDVVIKATEVAYKNAEGLYVISTGVSHSVYAGGLIGHASEVRMISCIAFGNVTGESRRPYGAGVQYNPAFVGNVVGQSSQTLYEDLAIVETDYYIGLISKIFGVSTQILLRNAGQEIASTSMSPVIPYKAGDNGIGLDSITYLTSSYDATVAPGLGFDTTIWDFTDVDFQNKRYPRFAR